MELGSVLIGAILIVLCVVPFIIAHHRQKKRERKILKSLITDIEIAHISQHEFCGNYVIALDETNNYVFFRINLKENTQTQVADLGKYSKCEVVISRRSDSVTRSEPGAIERLQLSFQPKQEKDPKLSFEFFNDSVSFQLYGELQSVEKWSTLINDRIKS